MAAALRERKQGEVVTKRTDSATNNADTSGCCLLKTTIIQKGYAFVFLSAVYEWLLATTFDQTGASGEEGPISCGQFHSKLMHLVSSGGVVCCRR